MKSEAAKTLLILKNGNDKYNDNSVHLFQNNLSLYKKNMDFDINKNDAFIKRGYAWHNLIKKKISIYDKENIMSSNRFTRYINKIKNKNIILKYFYEKVVLLSHKLIEANISNKKYDEINIIYQKFVFYVSKVIKHNIDIKTYMKECFVNPKTIYDAILKKT